MKTPFYLALTIFAFLAACKGHTDASKTMATTDTSTKIEVIDFYGTHRCVTCKAIEANAKYTVENFFPEAVKEGKLSFKTVYVDDEKNYDMAEKFEATGTALFLNVVKNGQEKHIDLTEFAFAKGRDKEAFSSELKSRIETELKAL